MGWHAKNAALRGKIFDEAVEKGARTTLEVAHKAIRRVHYNDFIPRRAKGAKIFKQIGFGVHFLSSFGFDTYILLYSQVKIKRKHIGAAAF
jgi:hypothetical protein